MDKLAGRVQEFGGFVEADFATGDYVEYEWDHRNRLVAVEFRTSTETLTKKVEFDYDLFDRLIAKRVDDDGNGTFDRGQSFVYDGLDIVLVFDDTGSLENRFLHGPAVDQLLAAEDDSGGVLWPLADNQGTIRDVAEYDAATDSTSVVNHLKYDSFGNITGQTSPTDQPLFAFTGRYWDADIDLQWNWKRWYDPETGVWLSEDPLGFAAGDTNLARYVSNSPANFVDPTGLTTEQPFGAPPLNPRDYPEVFEMMARMNGGSGEYDDSWGVEWTTVTSWVAEIGSLLPIAGEVRDAGELMLGRDIWGNELTGTDRLLTGVGLMLPLVPASAVRRMGRIGQDAVTDPMKYIRPIRRVAQQIEDPMKRIADLPIFEQAFDVADEFLEKIDEVRTCFVAGTQVVVADSVEESVAMSTPEAAEADDGLSALALAAATVPVALTGYGRLRRRKRPEVMSDLDEVFASDDLFPETPVPSQPEDQSIRADRPHSQQRSRFRSTLALAWLVGWLALGGFLFFQGASPAERPGAAPAVAGTAPVEQAPEYRTKNIEDLQPGELVLAADPETGRVEPKRVLEAYRRTSNHLRLLTFADRSGRRQQLQTTDEHPFWVPDREEFVDAGNLSVGEKVVGPHGEIQLLASTIREPHPEGIEVFNFKVEDFHTYFVAAHGRRGPPVLVHNTDCPAPGGRGYRVMSEAEYSGASVGQYSDSLLVRGDPDEMGKKWLWMELEEARAWRSRLQSAEPENIVIVEIPTRRPLTDYELFLHPPEGTAVRVPIEDLDPAKLIED